ncbi:MAG TPA: MucB/RseB C-terminal domain-containing protein [Woeseiaceae bacterium]|nr:MucB/RseB C-terminal domain-containing protein [Woeseiaceae bacterium]
MTVVPRQGVALLLACGLANASVAATPDNASPREWLQRMSRAVQTTDYEGTVIRISDGRAEALKVAHSVEDGVVREKLIAQEGNGLEIVRVGKEVHCILPERRSVLVENWTEKSTLFSTLPGSDPQIGSEYDLRIVSEDRIAGRKAVELAIKPHDEYRYEHRIWLDQATGFPLQTELVASDGSAVDQVKFADIRFGREIDEKDLAPSYSTDNFKWYAPPARSVTPVVASEWENDDLPAGFELVSAQRESLPAAGREVMHLLYSDGLASVSVFIAENAGEPVAERSTQGASNTYSLLADDVRITAVGEVPAVTVERIARGMQRQ